MNVARSRLIRSLPDWAETQIQDRCDRLGIYRQRPTQDRTGWDFILEIPAEPSDLLPADKQPDEQSAKLQIKSKRTGKAGASINLLNARRFAHDSLPCFIIQFVATGGGDPVAVYVRHFSFDLIEETLRRARQADTQGRKDLHKIMLTIPFSEADNHTSDYIDWIVAEVRNGGSDYSERKRAFAETVGYGNDAVFGRISFPTSELANLQDNLIGLGAPLLVDHVEVFDKRFGMLAASPIFSGKPDRLTMVVNPQPAQVELVNIHGNAIRFGGDLRVVPDMSPNGKDFKARFSSEEIELLFQSGGRCRFDISLDYGAPKPLSVLRSCLETIVSVELGDVEGTMTFRDAPLDFSISASGEQPDAGKENFLTVIQLLQRIAHFSQKREPEISIAEMQEEWDALSDFNAFAHGPSAKVEATVSGDSGIASSIQSLLGFASVRVGRWHFAAVVDRPCTATTNNGARYTYVFGPPRITDATISDGETRLAKTKLKEAYQRRLSRKRGAVLQSTLR